MTNAEAMAAKYMPQEIADALRLKLLACPQQAMREQMLNALDQVTRAGGALLRFGW